MTDGWVAIDPDCHYGDHHWNGSSICSRCGKRLHCLCGKYVREDSLESHLAICVKLHPEGLRSPGEHRRVGKTGYVLVFDPEHHLADANGEVYEHRLIAEASLGRALAPGEVVHHINKIKDDNRPENLMVFASHSDHLRHERSRCKYGHDLSEDNVVMRTGWGGARYRQCIICERRRGREQQARRRARRKAEKGAAS